MSLCRDVVRAGWIDLQLFAYYLDCCSLFGDPGAAVALRVCLALDIY